VNYAVGFNLQKLERKVKMNVFHFCHAAPCKFSIIKLMQIPCNFFNIARQATFIAYVRKNINFKHTFKFVDACID